MNVLAKLVIPRVLSSINYILSELEELERENFFRLKRVKEGKIKSKAKELKNVLESVVAKLDIPKPKEIPTKSAEPTKVAETVKDNALTDKMIVVKEPDNIDEFNSETELTTTNLSTADETTPIAQTHAMSTPLPPIIETGLSGTYNSAENEPTFEKAQVQSVDAFFSAYGDLVREDAEANERIDDRLETGEWFETASLSNAPQRDEIVKTDEVKTSQTEVEGRDSIAPMGDGSAITASYQPNENIKPVEIDENHVETGEWFETEDVTHENINFDVTNEQTQDGDASVSKENDKNLPLTDEGNKSDKPSTSEPKSATEDNNNADDDKDKDQKKN